MTGRNIGLIAIILWLASAAAFAVLFVRGQTEQTADGRMAVLLDEAGRDAILGEMRHMLETVQGITAALSKGDLKRAAAAARHSGANAAADLNPALMTKLPLEFKQFGMSVHRGFDELANAAENGETAEQILGRLAGQLSSCVACHETYSLKATP